VESKQTSIRAALLQERGNGKLDPEVRSVATALSRRGVSHDVFLEKHLLRRRLHLAPDTLVVGHIPVVVQALRQLGVEPPPPNDYPQCLRPWLRRHVWTSTVREVVERLQRGPDEPFFLKPTGRLKRFPGRVLDSWQDLRHLASAADTARLLCSQVVTWKSERRAFVVRGTVVGVRHYLGDPSVLVDDTVVQEAVGSFEASGEAMAGYGIDFGVLATGETALVEVNEGYGLGSYGLEDAAYTDLLIARWCELTQGVRSGEGA
jgi:hypothetical protein